MRKYRNIKIKADGRVWDSKKEWRRYNALRLMERGGLITNLEIQPKFTLFKGKKYEGYDGIEKIRSITYTADFRYFHRQKQRWIVEDTKAVDKKSGKPIMTQASNLRIKIFKLLNPDIIHIIR